MSKNLLADTDYTDGRDKRFVHSVLIGRVSKLEVSEKGANVRIIMPDRLDHEGQPLITKPIPVLQISAGGKKQFAMPRLNQNCLLVKLPNSTSSYAAIGFFYTTKEPPPVTDPKLDYTTWEGGHTQQYNANDNVDVFLTEDFKAGWNCTCKKAINLKTTDSAKITITGDSDVNIVSSNGKVAIQGATEIDLTASLIKISGNIQHDGSMTTTGIHNAADGPHSSCGLAQGTLDERIRAIERRLSALDGQPLPEQPTTEGCC